MDWEAYLASLALVDRLQAERLAGEYGLDAAERHVLYNPVRSVAELETSLRRDRDRVRTEVPGLYESIDLVRLPTGWSVSNTPLQTEPDGTILAQMDVTGPNGAIGFFERGYHAAHRKLELRTAFLQLAGATEKLPGWVIECEVPMVPTKGIRTNQYFTL